MRSAGNSPFVKQVDFVEQHEPTIVRAALDAHAVKLVELELEQALEQDRYKEEYKTISAEEIAERVSKRTEGLRA